MHGSERPSSWTVANVWGVRIAADIQLTSDIATWEVLWDNTYKNCDWSEHDE